MSLRTLRENRTVFYPCNKPLMKTALIVFCTASGSFFTTNFAVTRDRLETGLYISANNSDDIHTYISVDSVG